METITLVVAVLGGLIALVVIPILLAIFLWESAKKGWHATQLPTGEIAFVVASGTVIKVLSNVDGHYVKKTIVGGNRKWEILPINPSVPPPMENPLSKWLKKKWGIYWVSWFWPLRKLHGFNVDIARLKPAEQLNNLEIKDWIQHEGNRSVTTLRWKIPRPFVAIGVELADKARVDLVITAVFRTVDPVKPIFIYKGRFFDFLMNVVVSETTSFFRGKSYQEFVDMDKSTGQLVGLQGSINPIIGPVIGLRCEVIGVVEYDINAEDKKVVEAAQALVLAEKNAAAKSKEAEGDAAKESKPLVARLVALMSAAGGNAQLAGQLALAEAIGKHQGPLSLGGGGHGLSILTDGGVPKPTPPQVHPPATGAGGTP